MKKAQVYTVAFVICATIFSLFLFFFLPSQYKVDIPTIDVTSQSSEFLVYHNAVVKEQIAAEQMGKYSAWNALFSLAQNGGFSVSRVDSNNVPCSNARGKPIALWNGPKDCFPTKQDLASAYNFQLQKPMHDYLEKRYKDYHKNNYVFSLIENNGFTEVIGMALKPLYFTFPQPQEKTLLKYIAFNVHVTPPFKPTKEGIPPENIFTPTTYENINIPQLPAGTIALKQNFHATLPYTLDQFMTVIENAKRITSTCTGKPPSCVKEQADLITTATPDQSWDVQNILGEPVYTFQVTENVLNPYFEEKPVYTFGLLIPGEGDAS